MRVFALFFKVAIKDNLLSALDDYGDSATGLYAIHPYNQYVTSKVREFVDFLVKDWGNS